jgi:type II secretory ATPase GspE/PulE/Tfp pilus assembly ATPase PilB-like protein
MPTPQDNPLNQFVTNLQREKEEELTQQRALEFGIGYQNLMGYQPNPAAVPLVPKSLAQSAEIFAFEKSGVTVSLALVDPTNPNTISALKTLESMDEYEFKPFLISESAFKYLISIYDTFAPAQTNTEDITLDEALTNQFSQISNLKSLQTTLAHASTSNSVELILAGAVALQASDIHIEPEASDVRLRYRLDGVLQDAASLPSENLAAIINRIKLLANLKLNIKEGAQDGRFSIQGQASTFDLRVSILPTQYGESIVMRILPQQGKFVSLDSLGLSAKNLELINSAIAQPNGLILNTGPTGSGKTTTLYAILAQLNQADRKIITVEDPIEYRLDGITQTQVNEEESYSFATALRAIVRQDPDILLVGEIRDPETADIAINASLTGHLVLSTLHTNDAAGSIPRLIDLQAKPTIFADALRLIIAQRLVRKLCPSCKSAYTPSPEELASLAKLSPNTPPPASLYKSVGCDDCNGTGYKGRIGIYELMNITPELKAKIISGSPAHELTQLATEQGMTSLGDDGAIKVVDGTTDLAELVRVITVAN